MLCGLGPHGDSLLIEVTVYSKGLRQVLRDGTARGEGVLSGDKGLIVND